MSIGISYKSNLHWILDVHFKDDIDQKSAKNSALNFNLMKRMRLNLLKQESSKTTMKSKKIRMPCDNSFLKKVFKLD